MKEITNVLIIACLSTSPAWGDDIFRCPGPNGSAVYQSTPCKGGTNKGRIDGQRQASAEPASQPESAGNGYGEPPRPQTDMERSKAYLAERDKQRQKEALAERKNSLKYRIAKNDEEIKLFQAQMDLELAELQQKKLNARNNLAGATWEQSISTEMNAVTSRYRSKIDAKVEENKRLSAELASLGS